MTADIISFPQPARIKAPAIRHAIPENPVVLIGHWLDTGFSVGLVPRSALVGYGIVARRSRVAGIYLTHEHAAQAAELLAIELGGIAVIDEAVRLTSPPLNGGTAA